MQTHGKLLALVAAIIAGLLLPQGAICAFLIPYLIGGMLYYAFLEVDLRSVVFDSSLGLILAANFAIAGAVYGVLNPFDHQIALVGFVTAISPTATAAPVIVRILGGSVAYVTVAVLITNGTVALILPLVAASQNDLNAPQTWTAFASVAAVIFMPFVLAQATRRFAPSLSRNLKRTASISFWAWITVLFLATASASRFIRNTATAEPLHLLPVATVSLAICLTNFIVGYQIGRPKYGREASQALGQKNTMLTVWFALTFYSPYIALGPTFYVIYHNVYNSLQIVRRSRVIGASPADADAGKDSSPANTVDRLY